MKKPEKTKQELINEGIAKRIEEFNSRPKQKKSGTVRGSG